ncbi:MAG: hypothetical protein ABSG82_05940 [Sedimentisphaerales bacterium]|jgi:hypothetical protein
MKPVTIFTLGRKDKKVLSLLSCLLVLMTIVTSAFADYEISRYTINGGGGTSTGGQYKLTGTIGQPDTAYSKGDSYELLGGFWSDGPLCIVDFEQFSIFAGYWLETGSGLPADLNGDGIVNLYDFAKFAYEWLCVCPYDWPLK